MWERFLSRKERERMHPQIVFVGRVRCVSRFILLGRALRVVWMALRGYGQTVQWNVKERK